MNHDLAWLMVNTVIAVTVAEGVALVAWHAWTGRGPSAQAIVANLLAGLGLLLALRSVLAGSSWVACALWLAAAGVAHAVDLRRRWPPAPRTHPAVPTRSIPAAQPAPSALYQGPP